MFMIYVNGKFSGSGDPTDILDCVRSLSPSDRIRVRRGNGGTVYEGDAGDLEEFNTIVPVFAE